MPIRLLLCFLLLAQFPLFSNAQSVVDQIVRTRPESTTEFGIPDSIQNSRDSISATTGFANFNQRAEEVQKRLVQVERVIELQKPLHLYRERYKEFAQDLNLLKRNTRKFEQKHFSITQLKIIKREWDVYERRFRTIEEDVTDRAHQLNEEYEYLKDDHAYFERAKDITDKLNVPEDISARIEDILKDVSYSKERLSDSLVTTFSLLNEVSNEMMVIRRYQDVVDDLTRGVFESMFTEPYEPLWKVDEGQADSSRFTQVFGETMSFVHLEVEGLWKRRKGRVFLEALFFVLIYGLFLFLRKGQLEEEVFPCNVTYIEVLVVPGLSALLLATMSAFYLYESMSLILNEMLRMVTLIPIAFLVLTYLRKIQWFPFFCLLFLILFDLFLIMVSADLRIYRILLQVLTTLAFLGAVFLYRNRRLLRFKDGPQWWVWLHKITWLLPILFGISFIANLFGFSLFSHYITHTIISAFYYVILFELTSRILNRFIWRLLHWKPLRQFVLVREYGARFFTGFTKILHLIIVLLWIQAILFELNLRGIFIEWLSNFYRLEFIIGEAHIAIKDISIFFLVMVVIVILANFLRLLLEEEVLPHFNMKRGVPNAVAMVSKYGLIVLGFFVAIGASGVDMDRVNFLVGALSVGIGFGLQNVVSNFVAGLVLLFERPVKKGDVVLLGDRMGIIHKVGIRASDVETFEGAMVSVPNNDLISKELVNMTPTDGTRRYGVNVPVAYGNNPKEIIELVKDAVRDVDGVLHYPPVSVYFKGFGASSLDFLLHFWTKEASFLKTQSDVTVEIYAALQRENIEVPFQKIDVKLLNPDGTSPKKEEDEKEQPPSDEA